jgi:aminoglycoside phosphotransferase family enzyme
MDEIQAAEHQAAVKRLVTALASYHQREVTQIEEGCPGSVTELTRNVNEELGEAAQMLGKALPATHLAVVETYLRTFLRDRRELLRAVLGTVISVVVKAT